MITLADISYRLEGERILDNVSFSVPKGAFACILGRSGAGKTTLIKIIARLLKADSGSVLVEGQPVSSYKPKELAKTIGYVPQYTPAGHSFTVEEYVLTGRFAHLNLLGRISGEDRRITREALELTELTSFSKRPLSTLSGGQLRRAMIACAIAQTPKVLLLDEPTIYLDPYWSLNTMLLLEKLHQRGSTVVIVSHDINLAMLFCGTLIGIREGKILFSESDIKKLLAQKAFNSLFGMEFETVTHSGDMSVQLIPGRVEGSLKL